MSSSRIVGKGLIRLAGCIDADMDRKNRELAKKNVELKERLTRMGEMHAELLKSSIKKEYLGARTYRKMMDMLGDSISSMENALTEFREFRTKIIENSADGVLQDKSNRCRSDRQGKVRNFRAQR